MVAHGVIHRGFGLLDRERLCPPRGTVLRALASRPWITGSRKPCRSYILARFNSGVHKAYTLFWIIGTAGAIQIPVIGWQPIRSLEQLGPMLVFMGYQVLGIDAFATECSVGDVGHNVMLPVLGGRRPRASTLLLDGSQGHVACMLSFIQFGELRRVMSCGRQEPMLLWIATEQSLVLYGRRRHQDLRADASVAPSLFRVT